MSLNFMSSIQSKIISFISKNSSFLSLASTKSQGELTLISFLTLINIFMTLLIDRPDIVEIVNGLKWHISPLSYLKCHLKVILT